MRSFFPVLLSVIFLAFITPSCSNSEVKLSKKLDGIWDATSYTIDGEQQIPLVLARYTMEFNDAGDGSGNAIFSKYKINYATFPPSEIKTVEAVNYEITAGADDADQLIVTQDSRTTTYDIELRNDFITLSFEQGGATVRIKADLR